MDREEEAGGATVLRDICPEISFGQAKCAVVVGQLNLVRICYPRHHCRLATHITQSQQNHGLATH
jgi:hypothetical protein